MANNLAKLVASKLRQDNIGFRSDNEFKLDEIPNDLNSIPK